MTTRNASRTLPQSGPRHQMTTNASTSATRATSALRPAGAPHTQHRLHAARASPTEMPVTLEYTSSSRLAIVGHAYRSTASAARRLAHRLAARLVVDERAHGVSERVRIVRRDGDRSLRRQHLAVAGDVRRDGRQRAREGAREHHPEALLADRRRDESLRAEERPRQLVLAQEADDVDPLVRHAKPREQEPYRERIGAGDGQPQPGTPMDVRPGPKQNLQPLPRLLPAREDDSVLAIAGRRRGRNEDAVRNHLVLTGQPASLRLLRTLGHGDAMVDAVDDETPRAASRRLHPAELAGRMERRDERTARADERRQADRRRHRLVQMEHVEALALERSHDPRSTSVARARCSEANRSPERSPSVPPG